MFVFAKPSYRTETFLSTTGTTVLIFLRPCFVVVVLVIKGVFELQDGVGEDGYGATFNKCVYISNQQDTPGLG